MQNELLSKVEQFSKQNKRKSVWRKIVQAMACIVVFCTTYALILPAITMERTTCEREEHTHSADCYIKQTCRQQTRLVCSYETLEVHEHTEQCWDVDRKLICGIADFVVHEHGASCWDINGELVCELPERREHRHSEECYQITQEENQPTDQQEEAEPTEVPESILICGEAEIMLHTHDEGDCYEVYLDENGETHTCLNCGKTQVEAHIHGDACFVTEVVPLENVDALTCVIESEEHTHSDMCYGTWEQICGKEEHIHNEYCEAPTGTVGYAYRETELMMFMTPRTDNSKTYHTDIEPLLERIIVVDSKDNLVYDSDNSTSNTNTVHVGEKCRVILYFKENSTNQFATDGDGKLTYYIPPNLSSDLVDSGVIINRNNENVANYTINGDELVITPILLHGENFFGEYNDVTLEIEFDAEVIRSADSDYTEIKFDNKHKVNIHVVEDGTLIPKKKQLHYDQATQTITYECTVTAHGGTVSNVYVDDWWWPNIVNMVQDSIQLKDAQGNNITDNWTYNWNYTYDKTGVAQGVYFSLIPKVPVTLNHGEFITLTYQVQLKDGIDENEEFNNTFAVHGKFGGEDVYGESSVTSFFEVTNVEKTGIYVPLGEDDTIQNALQWVVKVDNSGLRQITITDRLGPGQTYCEHKPIYIYAIRSDGTAQEFSIAWEAVNRNEANTQFTYTLPTEALGDGTYEFAEYRLYYYSHYTLDENDGDVQYFENTVETDIIVGNKPTGASAVVGVLGVPPQITKQVEADDDWLTFTVSCEMPAILNNRTSVLLYDTLASWGAVSGHIQQIPDSLTVTVLPEEGTAYELQPYEGQESADNTYLLGLDGQSFTMYFNTGEPIADFSTWKCPTDSVLIITYRISMDAPILDGWGGKPTEETLRQFLERTGQSLSNEAQLNYSPTDKVIASVGWTPPKEPDPPLIKTAEAIQGDGVYNYSVRLNTYDVNGCIFKKTVVMDDTGQEFGKNDILSLKLTDTYDSRMEYVPGSLKVYARDYWGNQYAIYRLAEGKVPAITSGADTTTMVISAEDLIAREGESNWLTNKSLLHGLVDLRGEYQFEFVYQLRVKQEVKDTTTEGILELDNTAVLSWTDSDGPKTVDPAHNQVTYDTGILQKDMLHIEKTNLVHFSIMINHNALDLAADGDTYVVTSGDIQLKIHEKTADGSAFPSEGVYIIPGDIVSKQVSVENVCDHPFYLRVKLVSSTTNLTLNAEDCLKMNIDTQNWTFVDGFYYYNRILNPGQMTPTLFTQVEIVGSKVDQTHIGSTLNLTVNAYAVQSENNPAKYPWDASGWPAE